MIEFISNIANPVLIWFDKRYYEVFGEDIMKNYPSEKRAETRSIHHFGGIVAFSSGKI